MTTNKPRLDLSEFEGKKVNTRDLVPIKIAETLFFISTALMGMNDLRAFPSGRLTWILSNLVFTGGSIAAMIERNARGKDLDSIEYLNDADMMAIQAVATTHAEYAPRIMQMEHDLAERHEVICELNETLAMLKAQKFNEQKQAESNAQQALENLEGAKAELVRSEQLLIEKEEKLGDRIIAFQDEQVAFEADCWEKAQQAVQAQFEALTNAIDARDQIIGSLQVPTPIKSSTREGVIAQRVVELLEEMGVILRRTDYRYGGHLLTVWGTPIPYLNGRAMGALNEKGVVNISEAMATGIIFTELSKSNALNVLQSKVPGCNNPVKLALGKEQDQLVFEIDLSPVSTAEKQAQQAFDREFHIPQERDEHLLAFIKDSLHINLSASTGRGKTTLLDFIIANLKKIMGSDVEIRYANPKPDRRYKGVRVDFIGVDESILGLFEAAIEIVYRVEGNNDVLRKGQDLPEGQRPAFKKYRNRLYLVDEINALVGYFGSWAVKQRANFLEELPGKLDLDDDRLIAYNSYLKPKLGAASMVTDLLKIIWRLGRSENIKLLIAGQNLMPSQMGSKVTKADMLFQSMIYSGQKPIEMAHKDGLIDDEFYQECLKTIAAEKSGHIEKYWGCFIPMDGTAPPSIIKFPAPVSELCGEKTVDPDSEIPVEPQAGLNQDEDGFMNPAQAIDINAYEDFRTRLEENFTECPEPTFEQVNPAQPSPEAQPGPHEAHKREWFYTVIVGSYLKTGSITQTINEVWGLSPSKNRDYQVAKWSIRFILKKCEIPISEKTRPEDRKRDAMNYRQLISYLEDN